MRCGVGDYTASLAHALVQCKDTSVAVLTDVAATPVPSSFTFEVFPIVQGWTMADVFRIGSVVHRWRPDLVHIQYPTQGYGYRYLPWFLPALFSFANMPVVQTWHEYHFDRARRSILNAALSGGLVAVKPDYKAKMPAWFRWLIRRKHFEFIPNASAIPRAILSETERSAVKSRFVAPPTNLTVYFGFAYPAKRIELLFEIADPARDHLVLVCDLNSEDAYHKTILDRLGREPWVGKVAVTGFLPAEEVGKLLAAADAVVLPFRDGGGEWNTSIHAAVIQGTFVLTTSQEKHGYDPLGNVYFARPDDVSDMRHGLRSFITRKVAWRDNGPSADWQAIAAAHRSLYNTVRCAS
jgi:glycosyltransferase involved in cell wall biosynthesis